jgi:hypothetical protein
MLNQIKAAVFSLFGLYWLAVVVILVADRPILELGPSRR